MANTYKLLPDSRINITVTTPKAGTNLLALSDAELDAFSLPRQPDRARSPVAFSHWSRALGPAVTFVETAHYTASVTAFRTFSALGSMAATTDSSRNWSGAVIGREGAEEISLVQGAWVVPVVSAGRVPPAPVPGLWKSSIWIGLDGYLPASRSMPQIGIEQRLEDAPAGLLTHRAWLWWWSLGEKPELPVYIDQLTVSPGHTLYAQILALDPGTVNMLLLNLTTQIGVAYTVSASAFQTAPGGVSYDVEGRTAEWIVERPTDPTTRRLYTLPHFGRAPFSMCSAVSTDNGVVTERDPSSGKLIRMIDWDDPKLPGWPVAMPNSASGPDFAVDYVGP